MLCPLTRTSGVEIASIATSVNPETLKPNLNANPNPNIINPTLMVIFSLTSTLMRKLQLFFYLIIMGVFIRNKVSA